MKSTTSLDYQTFTQQRRIYIVALGAIALFTAIAQFYIQRFLTDQIDDSRIINVSGKQRMLSQKITKNILVLNSSLDQNIIALHTDDLQTTLEEWEQAHQILKTFNTSISKSSNRKELITRFDKIEPSFTTILQYGKKLLDANIKTKDSTAIASYIEAVIKNEPLYLAQMDAIVSEYEQEAKEKVTRLKRIEYILFAIIIIILVLEFFLLFRPIAMGVKKTISGLLYAQEKAENMAAKAEELRRVQDENMQELIALTKAVNQTLLYARVDEQGIILSLGELFAKTIGVKSDIVSTNIADVLHLDTLQRNRLLNYIEQYKGGVFHEEFVCATTTGKTVWLDMSILTVFKNSGHTERLVLCTDISKRKEALQEVAELQETNYKEKEELQKFNAGQIVEAQEEERKRIAKEIHDSIGQMLTALKFNIESINLQNLEKATERIEGLKQLTKDLIRGTRMATFNLTPPELKDYGIPTALQKMTKELTKLTGKQILFENKSNFDERFDSLVETNLYRVTQEAVNNSIKYANTDIIRVAVNHSKEIFSITVEDQGKGFDISKVPSIPKNNAEGGMGLFFMKERMSYINGRIFINSSPDQGTRITINYPM